MYIDDVEIAGGMVVAVSSSARNPRGNLPWDVMKKKDSEVPDRYWDRD